jgi:hypothetical protein
VDRRPRLRDGRRVVGATTSTSPTWAWRCRRRRPRPALRAGDRRPVHLLRRRHVLHHQRRPAAASATTSSWSCRPCRPPVPRGRLRHHHAHRGQRRASPASGAVRDGHPSWCSSPPQRICRTCAPGPRARALGADRPPGVRVRAPISTTRPSPTASPPPPRARHSPSPEPPLDRSGAPGRRPRRHPVESHRVVQPAGARPLAAVTPPRVRAAGATVAPQPRRHGRQPRTHRRDGPHLLIRGPATSARQRARPGDAGLSRPGPPRPRGAHRAGRRAAGGRWRG